MMGVAKRKRCGPPGLSLGILASLLMAGSCSQAEPSPDFEGPRHVLLISLDTLRADACSLYGYGQQTTPFLEELAERGVVFEKHMVNSNNTLTSHATMFTGLLMMAHQADDAKEAALAPQHETLAERFRDSGFTTVGLASHERWLSKDYGMDQGFETFESAWSNRAEVINQRFVDWVESEKPRRIFGFLHYYDAHSEISGREPYSAPPEYLERFAGPQPENYDPTLPDPSAPDDPGKRLSLAPYLNRYRSLDRSLPAGYAEYFRSCYDAGVAKLDSDLRQLFSELDRLGILDDALIVITSDHGEEFEEHGNVLHNSFHDEIMHVPLMILPPKQAPTNQRRVTQTTRAVDIAPTLLDLAGLPKLETTQGRSLRPMIEGEELPYAKTFFGRVVLRDRDEQGEYKAVNIQKAPIFYDLDADPRELTNLYPELIRSDPERLMAAQAGITGARRECDLVMIHIGAERTNAPAPNKRQLAELEALGYVGGQDDEEDEESSADAQKP